MKKTIAILLGLALALSCAGFAAAAEALPEWRYTGDDPVEAAVMAYSVEMSKDYLSEESEICVPSPVIHRIDMTDEDHMKVYGSFWIFGYKLNGTVLECVSGGERPGVMTLTRDGDGWKVTEFDEVGDGDDYGEDIVRISAGDKTLEEAYFSSHEAVDAVRAMILGEYVKTNGLNVTAYKDYGWDEVPLFGDAAEKGSVLDEISGMTFTFSSGAGAWETSVEVADSGAFKGMYHDAEMGEDSEEYPDGTVYTCLFHGRFAEAKRVDEKTWRVTVTELEADEGQEDEIIADGIRYITSEPYGLEKGVEVTVYLPGTPIASLTEGQMMWFHIDDLDPDTQELPFYALWNEAGEAGFVGMSAQPE